MVAWDVWGWDWQQRDVRAFRGRAKMLHLDWDDGYIGLNAGQKPLPGQLKYMNFIVFKRLILKF